MLIMRITGVQVFSIILTDTRDLTVVFYAHFEERGAFGRAYDKCGFYESSFHLVPFLISFVLSVSVLEKADTDCGTVIERARKSRLVQLISRFCVSLL